MFTFLSEETLKAGGHFYLVSMSGEIRSQVGSSKQLTQEKSFPRISESTTSYSFTPCMGSFTSPGIDTGGRWD